VTSVAALTFSIYVVKNRLLQQKGTLAPELAGFTSTTLLMVIVLAGASLFEAYVSPTIIGWASPLLSS
ncbi:stage II sporulation protein M, partial [Paenibacillus sp. MCAF20]